VRVNLTLGAEDQRRLQQALDGMTSETHVRITLGQLFREWASFVSEVERGYDDSIYEYANDLSTRAHLARIEGALSDQGQQALNAVLEPLDERFRRATKEIAAPLIDLVKNDRPTPWFNRVPLQPGNELAEDLRSEGAS
jgi:hypothetical protein